MDVYGGEMVCPPPSIGWSALILWAITIYGVLGILSVFAACVQWRDPSRTGARIARLLSLADLASAALAPLVVFAMLGAPRAAASLALVQLALAALCGAAARRGKAPSLPPARLVG
jgi:hypothetical protein